MRLELQIVKQVHSNGCTTYCIVLYDSKQKQPDYTFISDVHTNVYHMLSDMWQITEHWWVYDYAYGDVDYTFVASGEMSNAPRPTEVYLLTGHNEKSIYLCHNELKKWFGGVPGVISVARQDLLKDTTTEKEEDHENTTVPPQ